MIEKAHFSELREVLLLLNHTGGGSGPVLSKTTKKGKKGKVIKQKEKDIESKGTEEEIYHDNDSEHLEEENHSLQSDDEKGELVNSHLPWPRQTIVVSATLTLNLAQKLKKKKITYHKKSKKKIYENVVDELLDLVSFKRPIKRIDLTTSKKLAHGLTESKVDCLVSDKDFYVYYFLLRYPSRTLIFVNSIDCLRRLASILKTLQLDVYVFLSLFLNSLFLPFFSFFSLIKYKI
jgi:ATP-dependent RNA helicase DDX24/MAK5